MYIVGAGMSVGRIAYHHDIRIGELPNNVDQYRVKDNVILVDDIKGRSIDQWINETMQPAIDAYNAKQKRSDRKIKSNYVEWHNNNGNYTQNHKTKDNVRIATEFVLSYGGHENLGKEYFSSSTSEERKKEIYNESITLFSKWIEDMKKDYPHLKIGLAVVHADEPNGFIHLHGIMIPQATYTRGLPVQCCWSRALEQDGIEKIQDEDLAKEKGGFQLARFYKKFRDHMEQDLIKNGYQIKAEEHGKKHLTKNAYTQLMKYATEIEEEAQKRLSEAQERIKKAEELESFKLDLEAIEAISRRPKYNPNDVKRIPAKEKTLFHEAQEEQVQMSVENFDSLRSSEDAKKIKRDIEEKIEKQNKLIQEHLNKTMTNNEKELTSKIDDLEHELAKTKSELNQLKIINQQKERLIERLKFTIEKFERFLQNRGLLHLFNQSYERKDRTR